MVELLQASSLCACDRALGQPARGLNMIAKSPVEIVSRDQMIALLLDRGWPALVAFGIAANARAESDFNIRVVGDHGTAFGLFQHRGERLDNFRKTYGKHIKDATLEEVMSFVHWELTNDPTYKKTGAALRKCKTAGEAAAEFCRTFERPAKSIVADQMRKRSEQAQRWWDEAIANATRARDNRGGEPNA